MPFNGATLRPPPEGPGQTSASVPAFPGFMGAVFLFETPVRATVCNVQAKQEMHTPEPISNVLEQPMWHFGPVIVEGNVDFLLVSNGSITSIIKACVIRENSQMVPGEVLEGLHSGKEGLVGRRFTGCVADTLKISATSGERVTASVGVLGMSVEDPASVPRPDWSAPGRVFVWNDCQISGKGEANGEGAAVGEFGGCQLKGFSFNISNNCQHIFAYPYEMPSDPPYLTPRSITTGARKIGGTLTFLGPAPTQSAAINNLVAATSSNTLGFGIGRGISQAAAPASNPTQPLDFGIGGSLPGLGGGEFKLVDSAPSDLPGGQSASSGFSFKFNRVVYRLQNISLNSGVLLAEVEWSAHGSGKDQPAMEFEGEGQAAEPA